jgi:hypothetical protein
MNIIKIFNNIILTDNLNFSENFFDENDIKEIIIIELDNEQIIYNDDFFNSNKIVISTNNPEINFDHTNSIIFNFLSNLFGNILIVSKNNILGFVIVMGFLMKYLKVSLIDCLVLGVSKNIVGLNQSIYIKHLNEYNLYLKNNKS